MNPKTEIYFLNALDALSVRPESIQVRVGAAYSHLSWVETKYLPERIRHRFDLLREKFESGDPGGDEGARMEAVHGTIMAAALRMSESEAVMVAMDIVSMADDVRIYYSEKYGDYLRRVTTQMASDLGIEVQDENADFDWNATLYHAWGRVTEEQHTEFLKFLETDYPKFFSDKKDMH